MSRETYSLMTQLRELSTKAKALRTQGVLPLVLYGRGVETLSLAVDQMTFENLLSQAGQSSIIMVTIEGKKEEHPVLIYDIQYNALSDRPTHADLYQVRMDEVIEAEVPLLFTGEAPAVKEQDGILLEALRSVRVKALPLDLPHEIEVSLEGLVELDSSIYVSDLVIADDVEVLDDSGSMVVSVSPPRSEEELEELDEDVDEASALESIGDVEGEEGEEESADQEEEASDGQPIEEGNE